MVPNVAEWCQMVPDGAEWYQIVPNGTEWYRMVPNVIVLLNASNLLEIIFQLPDYN